MSSRPNERPNWELEFLAGPSEMSGRMRAMDWSLTPLGPPAQWPQPLKTAIRIMLTSRYAMWMGWGPELTFLYNDAYGSMTLGAKHPWALGQRSQDVWAEIWPQIGPRIESVLRTGQATWDEGLLLFLERSGYSEETYHTFSYSPLADDQGKICGHLCVVTEETNRLIGERRLAVLKELASHLTGIKTRAEVFSGAEDCLARESRDLPFTLTYLFDERDPTGLRVASTGIPCDHPALQTGQGIWPLSQMLESPYPITIDLPAGIEWPNGPWNKPPVHAVVMPISHQGQSRPAGVFIAAINPFRLFDDAYQGFITLFVGQVAAALANARAYEEERRRAETLAELDRAKTIFFSNVSHEFRTPLTLLVGPLEEALAGKYGPLSPEQEDWIRLAHRNCLRLLKLVNTLLDFSRIEAGRQDAVYEATDVGALTSDLVSVFQSAAERAGLQLVCDCPTGESAFIDREMWEKIVLNLVSNALKFTLAGEIRVSLRWTKDRFELQVRDTGEGIPAAELPSIFERFHRVQGTRSRTHEGTGIGLALVSELVRLHAGTIDVQSAVGQGTTFTVKIPLGSAHLPAERIRASRSLASTGIGAAPFVEEALRWLPREQSAEDLPVWTPRDMIVSSQRSSNPSAGARILLADDNADMRDYVRRLLSAEYEVECVPHGRAALESIRNNPPDLIVSDIMMPELDGFGLLNAIRSDPALRAIPVILLSARAGEESRVEGMTSGADDYLVKPFSARELMARVRAHLEISRTRSEMVKQIQEREEHLRIAIEAAELGSWEMNLVTGHIHASKELELMYGLESMEGRNSADWRAFIHPEDRDKVQEHYEGTLSSGATFDVEYRILRADGAVRWLVSKAIVLRDEHGQPNRLIGVVTDITGRKLADQERERLLSSERAAREQAEKANRTKDEFLATVSHELRTPLSAMLGWARLLRGGKLKGTAVDDALETIERNAKSQAQLIEDLLDVSRIVTGQLRLDVQPVNLVSAIQAAADSVRPAADAKKIRLQMVLDPHAGPIAGDPIRMQQIVWNLLSNAIKFTPKDGRVQVRLERVNSHVEIVVSDNGMGIVPDFLPFVFDRFRQADGTITRSAGGLGLGLAIVRHIVELHGGTAHANSGGKNEGATFTIKLPLMPVHGTEAHSPDGAVRRHPTADLDQPLECPPEIVGLKVLIMDDEPDARHLISTILKQCKAVVMAVNSADEARNVLETFKPDILLSDIEMPGEDGYAFMRRLRAVDSATGFRIPAAALTAHASVTDRMRALAAGYDIHVPKPIEPAELLTVIASLASRALRK